MDWTVPTAGLLVVGTLSPGPNNLLVMREAADRGWLGALPVIGGVLAGGLAMLLVVAGGMVAVAWSPTLTLAAKVVAGVFLGSLGLNVMARHRSPRVLQSASDGRAFKGFAALFGFQFLNPKAWVLLAAAAAGVRDAPSTMVMAQLGLMFLLVSAASLSIWCVIGRAIARRLGSQVWLDRLTGALLVGYAALLLAEMFHGN